MPIQKAILLGLAFALAVGISATVAGGVLHKHERIWCLEGGTDCVRYHNYGWPWAWRTSMPDRALDLLIENSDRGFFSINEHGYSPGWFLFSLTVWFAIVLASEAVVAMILGLTSRLLFKRKAASA